MKVGARETKSPRKQPRENSDQSSGGEGTARRKDGAMVPDRSKRQTEPRSRYASSILMATAWL